MSDRREHGHQDQTRSEQARQDHERREHARIESEIRRGADSADPFAAAVRATRMPMLITDPNRPDNPIVFTNDAFLRLTGYTREEVIGRNCRFLQGPRTDRADVARIRDAIGRRVPIEIELLNHKKNGEVFWNRLLLSPVFGEDGTLFYFFASQFDVTLERDRLVRLQSDRDALEREVERRTHDLRRGEDHLRFILGAGRLGTWTLDLADRRLLASELCKTIFGRAAAEPLTYEDLLEAVVPEDRERMREAVNASIAHNADYDIEYRIVTPSGETRWVEFRGQTYYRADGQPLSMAGVAIDITGRKRVEEQRELLSAELKHRVKNSMATMQSIAHQTLRNAASVDEARATLDARLASLSAAHDILTRRHWEGATLDELSRSALEPFRAGQPDRFRIGGPGLVMEPRVALSLVLALHELATNAVKYGALSNDKGLVLLSWDVSGTPKPDRLWLRWEETGGPPVTPPTRNGFGRRMIERALAAELGGSAEIAYRPRGVVFTVDAPLPNQNACVGETSEA